MHNWQVALLVLAALFVGMVVPVLVQLSLALRESRRQLRALGEHLGPGIEDARVVAHRLRGATGGIEGREGEIAALFESIGTLATAVERLRGTTQLAGAVAAATAAAVRAFRETSRESATTDEHEEPSAAMERPSVVVQSGASKAA